MSIERKGWSRSRPLRVAFLIQDGEHASLALDGIFADCYNRWGGRFSLIVPCTEGRIISSYWRWLEAYDPDIVYSYVPLSREDVLEVHEKLSPAEYIFHEIGREPRLDVFGFKPKYGFAPLSSLSIIFRLARYTPVTEGRRIKILDVWPSETSSSFFTDNFGVYYHCRGGNVYPSDATSAANILTIIAPEIQADRQRGVPRDLDAVPNEKAAFVELTERRAISMSLASVLFAPKLDVRVHGWSESFNLVVGDSFADRVLHWNARLLLPGWLDTDIHCLRVSFAQLQDTDFLGVLGDFLKRRNRVNSGTGGQTQITIRSMSLSLEQLNEAQVLISSTKPWSVVASEVIANLEDIVPPTRELETARDLNRLGPGLFPRPDWIRFTWSAPAARPAANVPEHLADAPQRQDFASGYWLTEFILEHSGPRPRFMEENRWVLPRRWRMAGAFNVTRVERPQHVTLPPTRRSRDGNIAVVVNVEYPVEKISVPTSYEAIRYALVADGAWAEEAAEHGEIQPPSKTAWMEPSNEARYLEGVLGMSGGLQRASQFFLHPFLLDFFARLGGTPNISEEKIVPTVNRLRKKAQLESPFDLKNERERQTLARLIVKAANTLKSPLDFIGYTDLKTDWKAYRARYWAANPQLDTPDPDIDWDRREEKSLEDCLIEMRGRLMVFQGHQWTCQKCHHKNWVDLSALSTELSCEVCKRKEQTPVDIRWLFRPNQFLIESLRDHSALSLVWVLTALCTRSRRSFVFAEPSWFGYDHDKSTPDSEGDLLAVVDGEAVLCEVKSSWASLRLSDVEKFVSLAKRLRPDVALLAVMEGGAGPTAELDAAREKLSSAGIKFELLTLDTFRLEDEPDFRFYQE